MGEIQIPDGMVAYDVPAAGGEVLLRVGVISETGAIALLSGAPVTVMNDPATIAALEQALEQAKTDQARIHRELYTPREVTADLLGTAVCAYADWSREHQHRAAGGERDSLAAALAAVGLNSPRQLEAASRAYRHGYHGKEGSMRYALEAAIAEAWTASRP